MVSEHLEEMKSLKAGDRIVVYNSDYRGSMLATVESVEVLDEGDAELEDVQVYFLDEGTYRGDDGEVYDLATHEKSQDYLGWCTACDYIGRFK